MDKFKSILHFLRGFFPFQLLLGHIKYNFFSLIIWALLFALINDGVGRAFGLSYLFLSPEYQGQVSFFSFLLVGFSIGGFTMAFHMYSYIKLARRYVFMATISFPFLKFCLNNSLIPFIFIINYCFSFSNFQVLEEFATTSYLIYYCFGTIIGFSLFTLISLMYFFPRHKKFMSKLGFNFNEINVENEQIHSFLHRKINWNTYFKYKKNRRYIYLVSPIKWKVSRSLDHYSKDLIAQIMNKSRVNSTFFEILTILSFFILGLFRDNKAFDLPAAMSIILLITIIVMLMSALYSWLRYWTMPVVFGVLICMNFLSKRTQLFQYKNFAYGLNYNEEEKKEYSVSQIASLAKNKALYYSGKSNYTKILNNWKNKLQQKKPKLIIILTSGGGSRSASWTYRVLSYLDKELNGKVFDHTQFITGASGGMVGAAYFRALKLNEVDFNSNEQYYFSQISNDMLNKLSFSAFSNDLFFRVQNFSYQNKNYTKDRAYAFESQLDENTNHILNVPLSYYKKFEEKALIPTMAFTPTVVNDGRRIIISSQNFHFLCSSVKAPYMVSDLHEYFDFQTFFQHNIDIRFLSVLRASATFPLVLPMVSLPTEPEMHLMDAGIRDNYGGKMAMEYLYALKDWIKTNTSGVIILKIRDTKKVLEGETLHKVSLLNKLSLPFGNMYDNFPRTQDFDQDEMLKIAAKSFDFPLDQITFNLRESKNDRISLSWHLTLQEKLKIQRAINSKGNQHALNQLKKLLR